MKGYFVVEKLVSNVSIKAFLKTYTYIQDLFLTNLKKKIIYNN